MTITPQDQRIRNNPFKGFLPFFWLSLACLGGILLADRLSLPDWIWLVGVSLSLLAFVLTLALPKSLALTQALRRWTRADRRLPGMILVLFFFLGGWRYAAEKIEVTPQHVAYYNGRGRVQLVGVVSEPPDPREDHTNLTIQVEGLRLLDGGDELKPFSEVSGLVLLRVDVGNIFAYGDRLEVTGQLDHPFEGAGFSYRDYLARRRILSILSYADVHHLESGAGNPLRTLLYQLSDRGYAALQQLFPSPESDLLAGILLGRDQGLSQDLQDAFRSTGTTHIIAISGFNIAILAGLFSSVFTRLFGRKWGAVSAVLGIAAFTVLVGGEAAVVRAALMGGLGVLGGMFGRRQNGLNSLGLVVLLMALLNPNLPWDVGFQLSALATLGLILYGQPLEEWFVRLASRRMSEDQANRLVGPVSDFFLFTLAAQAMTMPIIAYHFGGLSWITLIANPLILPAQPLVLILGGLAMLAGIVLPGLGHVLAVIALPFVQYTVRLIDWLGRWPGGDLVLPDFHGFWLVIFYGLLFVFTLLPPEPRRKLVKRLLSLQSVLLVVFGMVIFVWNRVLTLPDGNLHLTLLDAQGTVLVQTPAGHAVLIGGGESPSRLSQQLGQMLPAGRGKLDLLFVGSAAREDLNGLYALMEDHPPEMVLWGINPEETTTSRELYAGLVELDVPIVELEVGHSLDFGSGVQLRVIEVGKKSAVLWLEWENFSALLPTGKVKNDWLAVPSAPDALLLPDDLEAANLPRKRMSEWTPALVLLPLDEADMPLEGELPLVGLLADYPLVTTLAHGWVRVSTDGQEMWVRGER